MNVDAQLVQPKWLVSDVHVKSTTKSPMEKKVIIFDSDDSGLFVFCGQCLFVEKETNLQK